MPSENISPSGFQPPADQIELDGIERLGAYVLDSAVGRRLLMLRAHLAGALAHTSAIAAGVVKTLGLPTA
jgi:hypothetical protein